MDIQLIGILVAVIFSAWFAGSETVFLSYNKVRFQTWLHRGVKGTKRVNFLSQKPERFLITTLTGNNLVNVLYSSLYALWFSKYGFSEKFIFLTAPIILLIFGETIPKAIANRTADKVILTVGTVLYYTRYVILPVVWLVEKILGRIQRWLGLPEKQLKNVLNRSVITKALHKAGEKGILPVTGSKMLQRFVGITGRLTRDIMTPRTLVTAMPLSTPIPQARKLIIESGFSRLLVYGDDLDDVKGVIFAHEILRNPESLSEILRPLQLVPESLPVINLISWMRKNSTIITGVIDEFGGFEGIVTIEDLAEELVGVIDDEYDSNDRDCIRLSQNVWLVSGRTRLSILTQKLGFEAIQSRAASIGGAIMNIAGGIPDVGSTYDLPKVKLRVVSIDKRSVKLVRITVEDGIDGKLKT
ncbi:hemolysin family protein [bacterium]|nr:hemolysin family protein [bacterium]